MTARRGALHEAAGFTGRHRHCYCDEVSWLRERSVARVHVRGVRRLAAGRLCSNLAHVEPGFGAARWRDRRSAGSRGAFNGCVSKRSCTILSHDCAWVAAPCLVAGRRSQRSSTQGHPASPLPRRHHWLGDDASRATSAAPTAPRSRRRCRLHPTVTPALRGARTAAAAVGRLGGQPETGQGATGTPGITGVGGRYAHEASPRLQIGLAAARSRARTRSTRNRAGDGSRSASVVRTALQSISNDMDVERADDRRRRRRLRRELGLQSLGSASSTLHAQALFAGHSYRSVAFETTPDRRRRPAWVALKPGGQRVVGRCDWESASLVRSCSCA